ncbi:MAG: MgtC/SapB family protein [Candidatus Makaraimicrobium thalassicum]|nr:MAG: MgtC/SapB family protein [Candidatus Omnitrophota bacterium]
MTTLIILWRVLLSAFLGGLIGIEREIHGCAAGLRTHILVCMGATLFMMTSVMVGMSYGHVGETDPSRIAAGVVTGVGFLGAGAIIRAGASIRGLTTAASIWAVAAIGLAVGTGMYEAAAITTIVGLTVLILSRLEGRIRLKQPGKKLRIVLRADSVTSTDDIKKIIETYGGRMKRITSEDDGSGKRRNVVFDLILPRLYYGDVAGEVASLSGIEDVRWK